MLMRMWSWEKDDWCNKRFDPAGKVGGVDVFTLGESGYAWVRGMDNTAMPVGTTVSWLMHYPAEVAEVFQSTETLLAAMVEKWGDDPPMYAVAAGVSEDVVLAARAARVARHAAERDRRLAETVEKHAKAFAREAERINQVKREVTEGMRVSAEDLLDLARSHGISVHPRTAGVLRRSVFWVSDGQIAVRGKPSLDGVRLLYREVVDRLRKVAPEGCTTM